MILILRVFKNGFVLRWFAMVHAGPAEFRHGSWWPMLVKQILTLVHAGKT
jgi:hypothetical protein